MKSDQCRKIACPYFGKFCGKAVCRFEHPKKFIKHLQACPCVLRNKTPQQ